MSLNNKKNFRLPNAYKLFLVISVIAFATISVFGLSLITGNKEQTNIGNSQASSTEPADINSDNFVNVFDLSILLSKWNTNNTTSDLNKDGATNVFDLSILLSKWGAVAGVTVGQGCPEYPQFPDANCTGWQHTGVTLSAYTGPTSISTSGTVIDSKDITSCISINANNVTIKRSRIRCSGGPESSTTYGIRIAAGKSGIVIEDVEVMSTVIPANCVDGDPDLITRPIMLDSAEGVRMTRVYAHNMRSGIWITGSNNTIIEDSYITTNCNPDPHGTGADWQHSTAIADLGGATNITIRHNNIDNAAENASSAMSLYPQYGPNDSFNITQNLFNSRAYFCAYFGYTPNDGESPNTRFIITDNVWGTKYNPLCGDAYPVTYSNLNINLFNTAYPTGWGNVWSGNTWKNGAPFTLDDL